MEGQLMPDCVCKINKIKLILLLTHGVRERHISLRLDEDALHLLATGRASFVRLDRQRFYSLNVEL
jgi:hypothetical protein